MVSDQFKIRTQILNFGMILEWKGRLVDDCVLYRIVPLTTTEAIVSLCDEPCFFPPLVL